MPPFRSLKVLFLVGSMSLPFTAQPASFDCQKASTSVERLICSNAALSELDTKLALRYEQAVASVSSESTLREQQREWLRHVRNKCKDIPCLTSAYRARNAQFEWTTTNSKENPLCEELRIQENRRIGLDSYALPMEEVDHEDATHAITNIDVDGDKIVDQMYLYLMGGASRIPPDNSSFFVVLSTTGKEYKVEAQRLRTIKYKSHYYVVTRNYFGDDDDGPVRDDVYRLDRSGLRRICSYECGLIDCSINE